MTSLAIAIAWFFLYSLNGTPHEPPRQAGPFATAEFCRQAAHRYDDTDERFMTEAQRALFEKKRAESDASIWRDVNEQVSILYQRANAISPKGPGVNYPLFAYFSVSFDEAGRPHFNPDYSGLPVVTVANGGDWMPGRNAEVRILSGCVRVDDPAWQVGNQP